MTKTMFNDRQIGREGFRRMDVGACRTVRLLSDQQPTREGRPVMRADIMRSGAAALLFLGVFLSQPGPVQALPIGGHPDKCGVNGQNYPTTQGPACEKAGGQVWCTNDGDYLCCFVNSQTGAQTCEQIEALVHPQTGGIRVPGGQLQMAPGTTSPSTPRFPQTGTTTPPIFRRGVEGEQPAEPAPGTTVPPEQTVPEQPSGTKPQ